MGIIKKFDDFLASKKGKKFELYVAIYTWVVGNIIGWSTIILIYLTTIAISGRMQQQTFVNTAVSNYHTLGIIVGWLMQTVLTLCMASLNRQYLKKIKKLRKEKKNERNEELTNEK